jgi:beta-galactosidase
MEAADGEFTFEWLHDTFRIFQDNGLKVILCTPTASAPPWLVYKHPETLKVDEQGKRAYIGVREHTCYTSDIYCRYSARIIERMACEFNDYPNLFAWQLDNEIGQSIFSFCYCDVCKQGFRDFLQQKYGSIEKLNQAWGNTFWSLEYSAWEQVEIGGPDLRLNPSQVLDSQLFRSRTMFDFAMMQADIIRKYCPDTIITTNNYTPLGDRREIFQKLDVASGDFYVNPSHTLSAMAAMSDRYRCYKPGTPAWVLEVAPAPWRPGKNLMEFMIWEFIARGQDVQVFFHWRSHPAGKEKINPTFISFGNKKTDSFRILKAASEKVHAALDRFGTLPQPECEAAVLTDFTSDWIFIQGEFRRFAWINNGHGALLDLGINSDIISPEDDLSGYKLLLIPVHAHFSKAFADKLRDFIRNGGVVLMSSQSGIYDAHAKYLQELGPEHLCDVFGMEVDNGVTFLLDRNPNAPDASGGTIRFSGTLDGQEINGIADKWIASIESLGAEVPLRFTNGMYEGMPFMTEQQSGKGCAMYCGAALLDEDSYRQIVRHAVKRAGVRELELPRGVEVIARGPVTFVLNYSENPASFDLPLRGHSLLNDNFKDGHLELPPHGYCVVETGN